MWIYSALPVADTDLWVSTDLIYVSGSSPPIVKQKPGGGIEAVSYPQVFHILVFNANGVVADQKEHAFWVNKEEEAYRFEPGNRAIIFRSPQGFKKYDVVKNTLSDLPTNRDTLNTDPLP